MDKVSVFESSDFGELRIIVDPKGDVWFVASDVAKSLGYINAKDAVKRHVDDDDSMLLQVSDNQWGVKRSILKTRYIDSIRIINESGLYSLILSSKLESAKRFKKWVTSEVLPSIRKTGEYKQVPVEREFWSLTFLIRQMQQEPGLISMKLLREL